MLRLTLLCLLLAGPAHAALLDEFPGTWAIGTPAACRTAPYDITLDGGALTFRDAAGRTSVERVIETRADSFTAATERSAGVARGVRWTYTSAGTDLVEVQQQNGRSFVLVRCGTGLADAAPAATAAEAVLTRLFDVYRRGSSVPYPDERYMTPGLSRAIDRVFAISNQRNEAPCLNGDPYVDAQEFTITDVRVRIISAGAGRASAAVAFRNDGAPRTTRFEMLETDRGWRIDDIGTASLPSLRRFLAACR